mmetsp:Transcript_53958/g.126058  ORF Transcript_53958/g.126058 Transcript_53958/m.126058 type:complete len:383 (-) Transcript_53958:8-1156(-)
MTKSHQSALFIAITDGAEESTADWRACQFLGVLLKLDLKCSFICFVFGEGFEQVCQVHGTCHLSLPMDKLGMSNSVHLLRHVIRLLGILIFLDHPLHGVHLSDQRLKLIASEEQSVESLCVHLCMRFQAGLATFVVLGPQSLVAEYLVGVPNVLELLRSCIIARILVWMVLTSQFVVSLLDFTGGGAWRDAQDVVVLCLLHLLLIALRGFGLGIFRSSCCARVVFWQLLALACDVLQVRLLIKTHYQIRLFGQVIEDVATSSLIPLLALALTIDSSWCVHHSSGDLHYTSSNTKSSKANSVAHALHDSYGCPFCPTFLVSLNWLRHHCGQARSNPSESCAGTFLEAISYVLRPMHLSNQPLSVMELQAGVQTIQPMDCAKTA